ncbi:MAG: hypothetical protein JKY13_02345, partial [Gammaproteobacteria bacterium]|nr:hypothetical protein [Gammaproteobacteria bacterium]
MSTLTSTYGKKLYQRLPAVYRERDKANVDSDGNGDLAKYLDAFGSVLDSMQQTLAQRLADNFVHTAAYEDPCQDWLLPYFAKMLSVKLVSSDVDGQRMEIANAIRWSKRKGTLDVVREIAESLLNSQVVLQEAWPRIARIARIPRVRACSGDSQQQARQHKVTPDLSSISQAVHVSDNQ